VDDIIIRKATPNDAEAVCAVLVRSIKGICAPYYENDKEILAQWLENKTPDNVRQWIESDRSYCVVAVDGKDLVVGFANISGSEIMLNYVLPEALHQGIGKRMLQALENHAIAAGVEQIEVVSSVPAKEFYERNGYVSNGAPRYVGRIIGDFPLIKRLSLNKTLGRTRSRL
jgi:histone acetyltransferase (RNA polymerase elongator complex component)